MSPTGSFRFWKLRRTTTDEKQGTHSNVSEVGTESESASLNGSTVPTEQQEPGNRPEPQNVLRPVVTHPITVWLISLATFACLLTWLIIYYRDGKHESWWKSRVLGGRYTQGEAKAIDFVTGTICSPLLIAGLSFIWFACARSSLCVERGTGLRGVPLRAFAEASCTFTGSYNPFKFKVLLASKRLPAILLAFLALAVGLASSFLSNVIAYESFDVAWSGDLATLVYLRDNLIDQKGGRSMIPGPSGFSFYNPYGFTMDQNADFANQFSGLLTGMSFTNSDDKLEAGPAYIGINATKASLTNLNISVTHLSQVGAYRLTPQCNAIAPSDLGILEMGEYTTSMSYTFHSPDGKPQNSSLYNGYYPGVMSSMQTATNDKYFNLGFSPTIANHVYLGVVASMDDGDTRNSSYGNIVPTKHNMTMFGFSGTKAILSTWGLNCTIFRQYGTIDLIRENNSWRRENASFSDVKNPIKLDIADWQLALGYSAPGATLPGIAGAMIGHFNGSNDYNTDGAYSSLDIYASNFLYATAETERIALELAASNNTRALHFSVPAVTQRAFYRITYVPALLLSALVLLCVSSLIVVFLVWYAQPAILKGRKVDVLRLISDSMTGLQSLEDKPEENWSLDKLENWGDKVRVHYFPLSEDGRISVRLDRV